MPSILVRATAAIILAASAHHYAEQGGLSTGEALIVMILAGASAAVWIDQ